MHGHVVLAVSAVMAAFVTLPLAVQDNWFVAAQAGLEPTAVGCSQPDVLGDSVCIAVSAGDDGPAPTVWLFGDTEALWDDAVAVSVDDGEVFVAVRESGRQPEWTDAEAGRLIRALRTGSTAFVTTGIDDGLVDLSGAAGAIGDALGR